jgi:hypothetical protein
MQSGCQVAVQVLSHWWASCRSASVRIIAEGDRAMSFLGKLFGKGQAGGNSDGLVVDGAVMMLSELYDDPEVKSERGLSLLGPRANEVRAIGRRLHKAGGRQSMMEARDALRGPHGWAIGNLESIWSSLPEWRT